MIEILKPTFVPDLSKARKVLNMTRKDDAEDLNAQETELTLFLKKKYKEEKQTQRGMDKIRADRIRKTRARVRKLKAQYDQAVRELEAELSA